MPGTGKLIHLVSPTPNEHVRVETGVREGDTVSVYYDPMIAKLVVWGSNRVNALNRLRINLEKYQVIIINQVLNFLTLKLSRLLVFQQMLLFFIVLHLILHLLKEKWKLDLFL